MPKRKTGASEKRAIAALCERLAETDGERLDPERRRLLTIDLSSAPGGGLSGLPQCERDRIAALRLKDARSRARMSHATTKARAANGPKRKQLEQDNERFRSEIERDRNKDIPDCKIAELLGIGRGRLVRIAGPRRK